MSTPLPIGNYINDCAGGVMGWCDGCVSHFISPAPVPRGSVGSDFAAMSQLYPNYVRLASCFIGVNPRSCNNMCIGLKGRLFDPVQAKQEQMSLEAL